MFVIEVVTEKDGKYYKGYYKGILSKNEVNVVNKIEEATRFNRFDSVNNETILLDYCVEEPIKRDYTIIKI